MWAEDKHSWIWVVARGGRALPSMHRRALAATLIALVATALFETVPNLHVSLTPTPFVLIGLPLGVFLGFRNSASYDRFWEGRRLWGALVNVSRSLGRQLLTLVRSTRPEEADEAKALREDMVRSVIAFAHACRAHLRDEGVDKVVAPFLSSHDHAIVLQHRNVPVGIVFLLGLKLQRAVQRGWINDVPAASVDASFSQLNDVLGGCERIRSTPIPFSYTVLMHRIVAIYCGLLPFGLADSIHYLTPIVVAFVSYALFGLDAIGEEVEDPFGMDTNDLPLLAISTNIEINLRQMIGDADVPAPVRPEGFVLR